MNTNPKAIRVLCFGDSNTLGRDPKSKVEDGIKSRFAADVRWTGQLQRLLGNAYEVIEEGLGGRTTNLNDPNSEFRNGIEYLKPCLNSHLPLDIIVLMLGTNDLKERFNRTAQDIARANKKILEVIKTLIPDVKIILVSSILVDEFNPNAAPKYLGATAKSKQLASFLIKIAEQEDCVFLDLAQSVQPSHYDGIHIDEKDQTTVAQLIYQKINEAR